MMDARAGAGELRFGGGLAVVEHEGEIGLAVGQVPGDVLVVAAGADLLEAEHVLIERGRLLQVRHLHGDVDDARFLAAVLLLVAADADDLGEIAVRGSET